MKSELRILILEDDAVDSKLIELELQRSNLAHSSRVVTTEQDFLAGLEYHRPDIILADYKVPGFDGLAALAVARRKCPDVPFIFVSGVMGEELAVEALKSGATDYVIKDKLGRLTPAILRALREVQERSERKRSEMIREALYRISELSGSTADMARFYQDIHQAVRALIPVPNMYIALYDPGRHTLSFPYYSDEKDSPPKERPLGNNLTDHVIRSGAPLLMVKERRQDLEKLGIGSYGTPAIDWLGVPLKSEGRTFGALAIQSYDISYRLGEPEQEIMSFVSQHIAAALEKMRTMELLRDSEQKHRTLLDCIRAPILSVRRDMTVNYCNQAYADLMGLTAQELEGRSIMEVLQGFEGASIHQAFRKALAGGQPQQLEEEQGGRHLSTRVFPTPWGTLSIAEDITDRRRMEQELQRSALVLEEKVRQRTRELAEANEALKVEIAERQWTEDALRKSEEKYRFLYEESPTINIIIGANGTVQDVNRVALERLGYRREEVVGTPVLKFVAFEQREAVMADLERNFRGESTPELQVGVLARDGSLRTILFSQKNVMIAEEGQPASILISGMDITDRTQSDEARMKYEFAVNASKDLMTLIRSDQVYEAANEAYCQAHRKDREEIVGRTVEEVWGPEAAKVIGEYLEQCFRGQEVHYQKWFEFAALGRRFFDVAYYPYRDQRGVVTHVVVVSRDRTEYKLAEDRMAESQRALTTLLSNLPGMAYRRGGQGGRAMEFASQGCLELTGHRPEELVGKGAVPYDSLVFEEDRELVEAEHQNAAASRQPFQMIYRIRDASGEERWVWEQGRWVYAPDGQALALEGFVVDITDRKRAERALWEKEEHYRNLFENMPIGVYRTNPEGQVLMANPFLVRMVGYDSLQELQRVNLEKEDIYGPGHSRARFRELIEREGLVRAMESEWRRKDGSVIYVRENAIAIRDQAGKTVYYEGTVEDITEQRHARLLEAALYKLSETTGTSRDIQEFYRSVHGVISQLMYARNFYVALVDPATRSLQFPYYVDERDPRPAPRPFGNGITEHVISTGQPLLATGNSIRNMVSAGLITYHGTPDCCWLGVPLKRGEKAFGALVVHSYQESRSYGEKDKEVLTFVSHQIALAMERKSAEEERKHLVAAIEQAAEGVVITDPQGLIRYSNPAFQELSGRSREQLAGLDRGQVLGVEFQLAYRREIAPLLEKGRPWHGQFTMARADGAEFEAEATLSPVTGPDGTAAHVAAVRDVTEQRRLRSIAEAVNTMENIGYVFSGIRHEIGNALTSIKMAIGILSKNLDSYPKETIIKVIEMASKEVSRMEDLLRSLKNFSMYESLKPERVEVNQFLGKIRLLAGEDFRKRGISIEARLHPGEIGAWLDPRALQQVLLNLLANSADALQGREDARIVISSAMGDDMLEIAVEDNGCGIDREQQRNLFKPFYTSKPSGTGLGLVITKNIMVKMNGEIEVESERGRGTKVTLRLPAASS
jgi:PAS domain S-box-containing protein